MNFVEFLSILQNPDLFKLQLIQIQMTQAKLQEFECQIPLNFTKTSLIIKFTFISNITPKNLSVPPSTVHLFNHLHHPI